MSTLSDSSVLQCTGGLAPDGQTTIASDSTSVATLQAMQARISEVRALTATLAAELAEDTLEE